MRYKITARSQHPPHHFLLRIDGKLIKDTLGWVRYPVRVGDTGTVVNDAKRRTLRPDAIEIDYVMAEKA